MHIHFIGICGTAMGNGALMMRALGHRVTGSDDNIYPPMSDLLREQGIEIQAGFDASHFMPSPELVIVGNAMSRGNAEVEAMLSEHIPFCSLPELLRREVIQGRESIVVAGTHGKSTTASLMAWVFEVGGKSPNFLIGGVPENFGQGYKVDAGSNYVILEGDEYDTAFFDKRSKFLHYLPTTLIVNNIEFDHADIFATLEDVKLTFKRATLLVPQNGVILANGDDSNVAAILQNSPAPVETFGLSDECFWQAREIDYGEIETTFGLVKQGKQEARLSIGLLGEFSVRNSLAVIAAARRQVIGYDKIQEAFDSFKSIKRRMEFKGEYGGVKVFDDFAHHPTAIKETLKAVRQKFPRERVIAIFEPRSNTTRRNIFQHELATCFAQANVVFISQIARLYLLEPEDRLDPEMVIQEIKANGSEAYYLPDPASIVAKVSEVVEPGDVVIVMSNGSFGGIHPLLQQALTSR
jgi:UDP-N-acetylmuramate: L-alanyl-gamma-D-glutamyl-meso-diaminopimelate ligase